MTFLYQIIYVFFRGLGILPLYFVLHFPTILFLFCVFSFFHICTVVVFYLCLCAGLVISTCVVKPAHWIEFNFIEMNWIEINWIYGVRTWLTVSKTDIRTKIFRYIFHTNKLISTNFDLDTKNLREVICGLLRFF